MGLIFNFDEEILNSRGRMIIRDFFGTDVKKKKKWPKYDTFSLLTNLKRAVAGLHILISLLSVTGSLWQALGGLCRGWLIKRAHVKKSNMKYYVENYKYLTQFQWFTSASRFSSDANEMRNLLTQNLEALSSGPEI